MTKFSETVTPDNVSRAQFVQITTGLTGDTEDEVRWQLYALDSNGVVWTIVFPEGEEGGWKQLPMRRIPNDP